MAEADAALPSVFREIFSELASTWKPVTIGDVAIETRYGTSRKCGTVPVGLPILRIPNVAQGSVNLDDLKYCQLDAKESNRIVLKHQDLLFVRTNGSRNLVGRCAIYEKECEASLCGFASYLIRVRLDRTVILPHYLSFFLRSTTGREEIDQRRRTSAGQFNINSENLRSIPFPLPSIGMQARVVALLKDRQAELSQLQRYLYDAQAEESLLLESILRKAFSGEL